MRILLQHCYLRKPQLVPANSRWRISCGECQFHVEPEPPLLPWGGLKSWRFFGKEVESVIDMLFNTLLAKTLSKPSTFWASQLETTRLVLFFFFPRVISPDVDMNEWKLTAWRCEREQPRARTSAINYVAPRTSLELLPSETRNKCRPNRSVTICGASLNPSDNSFFFHQDDADLLTTAGLTFHDLEFSCMLFSLKELIHFSATFMPEAPKSCKQSFAFFNSSTNSFIALTSGIDLFRCIPLEIQVPANT